MTNLTQESFFQGEITATLADEFKDEVYGPESLGQILSIAGCAGGSVLTVVGILALVYELRKRCFFSNPFF